MTRQAQEISFREADGCDATHFLAFMAQVAGESDFLVMDDGGLPHTEQQMADALDRSFEAPDQLTLLALADEGIIGIVSVRTSSDQKVNHIGDLFIVVKQAYWGCGIGRLLLEETIEWAEQEEVLARLELTVQARNNRAVNLYQRAGFEIEGTKKRGAKTASGEFLDVYLMAKMIG